MSPPGTQIVRQSPESIEAIGLSIASALRPSFDAMRQDKDDRHAVRNSADSAINLATIASTRIDALEKRVDALLGDGTGENGKLAVMGQNIRKTQDDTAELKSDMKVVLSTMSELKANSAKSNTFMDGWRGVMVAGSVILLALSIVGGIIGVLVKIYK